MGETKIEWATTSWNPITGCTPISEGCKNCYAKRMAERLRGRYGYPSDKPFEPTFHPARLGEPAKWKKPRRVFICSMGDIFHETVPFEWMTKVFSVMREQKKHTFMVLTKRPARALEFFDWHKKTFGCAHGAEGCLAGNIWIGVTAENQVRADERIPLLLQIPAAVRFVSIEPMLGPVKLKKEWLNCPGIRRCDELKGGGGPQSRGEDTWCAPPCPPRIEWVICGGETGPGARPMRPDWARSLRDQCEPPTIGVEFFFKQWGGCEYSQLLDGKEYNQYPEREKKYE